MLSFGRFSGRAPFVQRPRTPAFHAGNTGSNPVRGTSRLSVLFPAGPEDSCDLELKWEPLELARASRVAIYLDPADPADRANWPTYRAWSVETLGKLRQTFSAPINELQKAN